MKNRITTVSEMDKIISKNTDEDTKETKEDTKETDKKLKPKLKLKLKTVEDCVQNKDSTGLKKFKMEDIYEYCNKASINTLKSGKTKEISLTKDELIEIMLK